MTNHKLLTNLSVAILGGASDGDPAAFFAKESGWANLEGIEFFESGVDIPEVALTIGADATNDVANIVTLFGAMSNLTPAQAADERLWVTITLGDHWEYAKSRYPIASAGVGGAKRSIETRSPAEQLKDSQRNWLRSHFFAGTARVRVRDNAVSRLWWLGHYASRFADYPLEDVLYRLIGPNQDVARTLLTDRPWIASSPHLAKAVMGILMDDDKFGKHDDERQAFRRFVKRLDLLAGRRVLGYLSVAELRKELEVIYYDEMK
jgi:hypothetical protein